MTIDEQLKVFLAGMESLRQVDAARAKRADELLKASEKDGENIRALERIAEIRGRRLSKLEG